MPATGQSRHFRPGRQMSACLPTAADLQTSFNRRFGPEAEMLIDLVLLLSELRRLARSLRQPSLS